MSDNIETNESKRGIIHCLFWKLHTNYLKNNREETIKYLGMLSEYDDFQIHQEINTIHFLRFLRMKENIKNNNFQKLYGEGFSTPIIAESLKKEKTISEKEFGDKIFTKEGRSKLREILNLSDKFSFQREYDIGEGYGIVDFLIQDGRKLLILELKVFNNAKSNDSVISQIDRYKLGLELNMCLGLYDSVEAFGILENISDFQKIELSRMGIGIITHNGNLESLKKI